MTDPTEAYIELLKGSLTHSLYGGADAVDFQSRNPLKRLIKRRLRRRNLELVRIHHNQEEKREVGDYWPLFAQTMIGKCRLDNLQACVETVFETTCPGT